MSEYLAILKAAYDYEPQSADEVALKEDQLLFLLERTDEEWWKVKIKGATSDEDEASPTGLVPAAYVDLAQPMSTVKVLYDYEAGAPGELSISEDEILNVFVAEEEWILVQSGQDETKIGYVPGNYVEEAVPGPEETMDGPSGGIVVPDSPPPPVSNYIDPAERVAANKLSADKVDIWPVSELDKKGKKKKGTLGVGNGAVFFTSEADKTPVQKWKTGDIVTVKIEKSKDVLVEIGGATPASLRFHAGSKSDAEAITAKLESSKALSEPASSSAAAASPSLVSPPPAIRTESSDRSKSGSGVHFSSREPSIISPREVPDDDEEDEYEDAVEDPVAESEPYVDHLAGNGDAAVALYDFTADGEDELSIVEGARLLVLEMDNDEWWKIRDADGLEGVVPASYIELLNPGAVSVRGVSKADTAEEDRAAAREAEEEEAARLEAERADEERLAMEEAAQRESERKERQKKAEEDRRVRAVAAAEREKKRMERAAAEEEAEAQGKQAEDQAARKKQEEEKRAAERAKAKESTGKEQSARRPNGASRSSQDRPRPSTKRVRVWHDRTGQFQVDAEFLGVAGSKLRLHKTNGVVIEVPLEKMSAEDMKWIERHRKEQAEKHDEDDEPLARRRESLASSPASRPSPSRPAQAPKKPQVDWFEFFLSAGCEIDDCTRYAASFERDKIDELILPDITDSTMRSLGLREGDIIRVKKVIQSRVPKKFDDSARDNARDEQMRKDAELAAALQAEENGGKRTNHSPLFTAGPGGALKQRRGRPTPSNSAPPVNVDLGSIANASEQISRNGSPSLLASSPTTLSPAVQPPKRASSAAPAVLSGFDDDPWVPRPSSTKPQAISPPPTTVARAPSAPPAQAAPPPPPPAAPPAPTPPAQASTPTIQVDQVPRGLAQTTQDDVFNQLARLTALRTASPAAAPSPLASAISPPVSSPPIAFGMGVGSSPIPMGQHLMSQPTGMFSPPVNSPRGPFAPVPANQSLLQPLIPTTTGFNNFVPTRGSTNTPMFQNSSQAQPTYLASQPTGFPGLSGSLMTQSTGYPGSSGSLIAQPTGFPNMAPQQTGFPGSQMGGFGANNGNFGQMNSGFGVQSNPTGFNPGFNNPAPTNDHSPANVFAKMKSGNFGDETQPQANYDALRPAPNFMPVTSQPTGWDGYQGNGYGGY